MKTSSGAKRHAVTTSTRHVSISGQTVNKEQLPAFIVVSRGRLINCVQRTSSDSARRTERGVSKWHLD